MNIRKSKANETKIRSIGHEVAQNKNVATTIQKKSNRTGLPDNLKAGIENLSGYAMDDVKVHYNSSKPAQLQAHAYAQGTDIHIASGQEKHLPHEAWHVVQQKQGRVQPTMQMKSGVKVNDNVGLEREADVMGNRAMAIQAKNNSNVSYLLSDKPYKAIQKKVVQRVELSKDELAKFEEYDDLLDRMEESAIASSSLPPLLGVEFYKDVEIAQRIISECLESGENPGPKAMSVIEWRMDELKKRWNDAWLKSAKDEKLSVVLNQSELKKAFLKEFYIWVNNKVIYNTGVGGPTSNSKTSKNITTTKEAFDGMLNEVKGDLDKEECKVFNTSLSLGGGFNATDIIVVEKTNSNGQKGKPKMTFHIWGDYLNEKKN